MQALKGLGETFSPHVLKLPMIKRWAMSGEWTPQALAKGLPPLVQAKRSSNRFFMYSDDGRPEQSSLSEASLAKHWRTEQIEMSASELVERCAEQQFFSGSSDKQYYYHTSALTQSAPELLARAAPEWESLSLTNTNQGSTYGASQDAYPSVWLGGAGSTTQAHYDVANNVLAQLYGRKRFRLWAPEEHFSLHVFPDAHRRARKAQVLIDTAAAKDASRRDGFPLWDGKAAAMDVVLEPGDSIFIPAFWFHHCEALGGPGHAGSGANGADPDSDSHTGACSISFNVFSPSLAATAAAYALASPLHPRLQAHLEKNRGNWGRASGSEAELCQLFTEIVMETLPGMGLRLEPSKFLARMHASRFEPLGAAPANLALNDACAHGRSGHLAKNSSLEPLADAFSQLRELSGDSEGVVEIIASHFIELIAVRLAGSELVETLVKHAAGQAHSTGR